MNITILAAAIIAASAALVSWALTHFIARAGFAKVLARKDAEIRIGEALRHKQEDIYEKSLAQLNEMQQKAIDAARSELALENEKALRAREDELHRRNLEEMKHITTPLNEQIKTMTEALESQKLAHSKEIASMVARFEQTARNMKEQTESLGGKADNLAEALKGSNKMQGNWGERIIQDILDQEGLLEGRDYDREEYLRDESGSMLHNEDSGKKMRPDYILHFPDNTDIIVDAKMNIDAYVDWFNAENEKGREEACRRNLTAVKAQIKNLGGKAYQTYVRNGRKTLGYVIMYVSNYGALQLAKQLEPNIVNEAFKQNVLITTEETFMPFLRMIHTAWVNVDQIHNQEKIVKQATLMCERVADLCSDFDMVGRCLKSALEAHDKAGNKLKADGSSIVHAAREVVKMGVSLNPRKKLPELEMHE